MQAVIVKPQTKKSAKLVQAPKPDAGNDEVLVRTLGVGIDGTDIGINSGLFGRPPIGEETLIIGHEAVGRVEAVGKNVTGLVPGDMVVPTVRRDCGPACAPCRSEQPDLCSSSGYKERGIKEAHGYLSEYFKESPRYLVKLPEGLKAVGPLIEPLSVGQKAVEQVFQIQQRVTWAPQICLVMGAGPLGILLTIQLRLRDLNVFTSDLEDEGGMRADIVKGAGAGYVDAGRMSLERFAEKYDSPDLIIDATGSGQTALDALNILEVDGILCLLSVAHGRHSGGVCPDCVNNKLVMGNNAVFGSASSNTRHFDQAVGTARRAEERWPGLLESVITQRLALADFERAFDRDDRSQIKSLIDLEALK